MPWSEFIGNPQAVGQLRRLAAAGRGRRTVVLAGPEGVGKSTLALMLGLSLNCVAPPQPGDFCGVCASCARSAPAAELDALAAAALDYRAAEVKVNPREAAPLTTAPHPAIRFYPPDGDFLSMAQARALAHQSHLQPDAGRTWTLVAPEFDRARFATQAALLKTLEEPPAGTAIVLLARNPLALLATVRSRALVAQLAPVPTAELAQALAARPGAVAAEVEVRARLAGGCPGRALRLDLAAYRQLRGQALACLEAARHLRRSGAAPAFAVSESLRADKEKFESLVEILYSVLQDLVYLQSGAPDSIRNVDCMPELQHLNQWTSPEVVARAVGSLDRIQRASSRNVFRPLALDSWLLGLAAPADPVWRPGA